MALTDMDLRKQINRLLTVFGSSKSADELVEGWRWVLGSDITQVELMEAVSEYAKAGGRFFPTPSQIRTLAIAGRRDNYMSSTGASSDWDQTLEGPCSTCGALLRLLEPEEQVNYGWDDEKRAYVNQNAIPKAARFGVLHDLARHRSAGTVAVGYWR